jgi:hypothetical protein
MRFALAATYRTAAGTLIAEWRWRNCTRAVRANGRQHREMCYAAFWRQWNGGAR